MGKPIVLLVDDEQDLLDILKSEFEERGCVAHTANDGVEALKVLKKNRIDIVITDMCMPNMNGKALLEEIEKQQGRRPFVVTMSGYSIYTPHELYDKGSAGFLAKPITYKQLTEFIEQYVKVVTARSDDDAA